MVDLQKLATDADDEVKIHYVPLDDLTESFLDGNSKKHDTSKIVDSIQRYGFKDPITFDPSLNDGDGGVIEGNGRLESLIEIRDKGGNLPRGIKKGWLVPVIFGVSATSEPEAIAYSVEHNWSVTWGSDIDTKDLLTMFDAEKLEEQLQELRDAESLPVGFGDLGEILETFKETEDDSVVRIDDEGVNYQEKFAVVVECAHSAEQESTYELLTQQGFECRLMTT